MIRYGMRKNGPISRRGKAQTTLGATPILFRHIEQCAFLPFYKAQQPINLDNINLFSICF
jgi:hypothetical protein